MSYNFKRIQFLDLNIYVEDGYLKTAIFSKPTDDHEYFNVRSWHQNSVFRSISNNRMALPIESGEITLMITSSLNLDQSIQVI